MKLDTVVIMILAFVALGSAGCRSKPWSLGSSVENGLPLVQQASVQQASDASGGADNVTLANTASDGEAAGKSERSIGGPAIRLISGNLSEDVFPASTQDGQISEELPIPSGAFQERAVSEGGFHVPNVDLGELPTEFSELSLREVVGLALTDRMVLRSLSGTVIRNPDFVLSSLDPDIQRSDANFGLDAAESQFDPVVSGRSSYANNDDFFNNPSTTGNASEVQQDLTQLSLGLDKVNQFGTRFSLNPSIQHDSSNNPSVFFPSAWESVMEATVQQPLMQGRGRLFNRVAGPDSRPGFFGTSGIEISRIDNAIEYSRFKRGLEEYLLELINAYWQLDLAYENYETIQAVRNASFETWQVAKAKFDNGLPGGEADREAQARAQFLQFQIQLDQALNAVQSGQSPGVLQAEANLRRLMNLSAAGTPLLRPTDDPMRTLPGTAWESLIEETLARRPELQQQRQRVTKANLLAEAAKNFTLPRLDAIATYRLSGLGDDLIADGGKFAGALNETFGSNYSEIEVGLTYQAPVGRRLARAGLRNARLQSTRERLVLEEMQQQIIHDLATSYRAATQITRSIELATMRRDASRQAFLARMAAYEADAAGLEDLLEAQRLYLDAELSLQSAFAEREQAVYRLESEQGSLLDEFTIEVTQ
ncbi:MAG: TolC family protein [Pirellulaceae bacterium]